VTSDVFARHTPLSRLHEDMISKNSGKKGRLPWPPFFIGSYCFKRGVEIWRHFAMINDTVKDIIAPCFWGAAVNSLDLESDKFLIVGRVLEHGGDRQVAFVFAIFNRKDIIQVVQQSSYLSPKTVNYGCL